MERIPHATVRRLLQSMDRYGGLVHSTRVPLRVATQRRSLRLQGFDYAHPGRYFVTIRVRGSVPLFGEVVDGRMCLSSAGLVAHRCWCEIPKHFHTVTLDAFVVMPDHVHGVIVIGESRNQPSGQSLRVAPGSLGAVIRAFKSATTKRINEIHSTPGKKVWQRNY